VVVGTTDVPVSEVSMEPKPFEEEIEFLLAHAARYLAKDPARDDILGMFAGLRPLVGARESKRTAKLSRDHSIRVSRSGLITIAGGKWTTYRKMAEDVVNEAAKVAGLEPRPSRTESLRIHGYEPEAERYGALEVYGSDAEGVLELARANPAWAERVHPRLDVTAAQVVWAARREMARTVEDVLSRRTRASLLDARAAREAAARVREILKSEEGRMKREE